MADILINPVKITNNLTGLKVEYPIQSLGTIAPVSLASLFFGLNTVTPNSSADRFVYTLPRFNKPAQSVELQTLFKAKALTQNTVTAGLDPAIHLYLHSVTSGAATPEILYDGNGSLNDFLPVDGRKYTGLNTLSNLTLGSLQIGYSFNNSDFASSALFAPSLANNQIFVDFYLAVHVSY